jgi:hypothetical protein
MSDTEENFIKIVVDIAEPDMGISGEGLWTVQVGPDLYEIRNSPCARNINWGDIVRAVPASKDKNPQFTSVVSRGGHRTIHVSITTKAQDRKPEFLEEFNRLGATYENANGRTYALDLEPEVDMGPLVAYLEALTAQEFVTYRISEHG